MTFLCTPLPSLRAPRLQCPSAVLAPARAFSAAILPFLQESASKWHSVQEKNLSPPHRTPPSSSPGSTGFHHSPLGSSLGRCHPVQRQDGLGSGGPPHRAPLPCEGGGKHRADRSILHHLAESRCCRWRDYTGGESEQALLLPGRGCKASFQPGSLTPSEGGIWVPPPSARRRMQD